MEPIQIQGKDYWLNLSVVRGSTPSGNVNFVVELYDEEPTFTNDVASVEPAQSLYGFGDAASLYHQLKPALDVLDATRSS